AATEGGRWGVASGGLLGDGQLAAADLDGDGALDLVGLPGGGGVEAWSVRAGRLWSSPAPSSLELLGDTLRAVGGAPTVGDLDGDGTPEVVVGRTVLEGPSGALRWQGEGDTGRGINDTAGPISCVADLDGDGLPEVIAGRTVFEGDGRVRSSAPVDDGFCGVGDVDPAPGLEVALVARGTLHVLGRGGAVLWSRMLLGRRGRGLGSPPALADLDGDGLDEIVVGHGEALAAYDPACAAGDGDCAEAGVRWAVAVEDPQSTSTPVLHDFTGDGVYEVLHQDEFFLRIVDGRDGTERVLRRNRAETSTFGPSVADVDGDGMAEILVSSSNRARPPFVTAGVTVFGDARGRWLPTQPAWTQHAFVGASVDDAGRLVRPAPTPRPFRQNIDADADPGLAPNLVVRAGHRCEGGRAVLELDVHNVGPASAPAGVRVALEREDGRRRPELETRVVLPPGGSVRLEETVRADGRRWRAEVDPTDRTFPNGRVLECDEGDNGDAFGPLRCP
ncbi:MAG TPA: FG-GAP-like repeat-containing protein, partial [Polyangiaceae bacterium LLY-WYZ-15_(1-7)]|nr:FG-GAP-like repeat-containing protein [Polyangiaceae bacterium LLY-WYZ-15_(1-7)]